MKIKVNLFVIFLLICSTLLGCSYGGKIKSTDAANLKQETASSQSDKTFENKQSNEEGAIIITLNNLKFDLNKPFEDTALRTLDLKSLSILRNSIYAKYGYIFSEKQFSEYFSQFSWYTPTSKNVEEKLNIIDRENIKNIISLEAKKGLSIKNSKDNKNYIKNEKVDVTLNGGTEKETLYITKENIKTSGVSNFPTKITLKYKSSQIIFESLWNDGLYLSVADFDKTDNDIDIYITEFGTDIGCHTYIYKFDGTKIYEYDKLQHFGGNFLYDEEGNIYCWGDDSSRKEINKCYNYKTKRSDDIRDQKFRMELTRLESMGK